MREDSNSFTSLSELLQDPNMARVQSALAEVMARDLSRYGQATFRREYIGDFSSPRRSPDRVVQEWGEVSRVNPDEISVDMSALEPRIVYDEAPLLREHRTPRRERQRRSPMEDGPKVHLTTRDGYKKTIHMPVVQGTDLIVIPESAEPPRTITNLQNSAEIAIRRRTFRISRKSVHTDLRTGRVTEEYWAVE
jgi:hypothetical protein